ncbi:MAG: dTMP kinase, partial [Candidatus Nanohaloarchaea archaeon]
MTDGRFIVIEGLDASGKRTQATMLAERFEEAGETSRYAEFPTHQATPIGKVIDRYLQGDYDVPPEVRALLYAADRYQFAGEFRQFLADGGILVADRYSPSNYAFQTTEFGGEAFDAVVDWMRTVESRLPQPDQVILLDMPPGAARDLMTDREKDVHEADVQFQQRVLDSYRRLAEQED